VKSITNAFYYILIVMRVAAAVLMGSMILMGAETRILVHGHRGARAMRPENTLPAFRYAIDAGVDVLELDMAVTKDNVLVVSHDPVLEPPVCTGPRASAVIHELTLAEVKEWDCGAVQNPHFPKQQTIKGARMPTLDEVFALSRGNEVQFNIETKSFPDKPQYTPPPEEFARLVLAAIRRHKLERRVIVQSFDYRTLIAMKKLAPEIRLSALMEDDDKRDFVTAASDAGGAQIVSPNYKLVTPERIAAAHAAGLQVVPWTVDNAEGWQRMVYAHADAIITDDPAALIAWLKAKGLRR
jgi:glycerophosphoryl diester phosphodiesterase